MNLSLKKSLVLTTITTVVLLGAHTIAHADPYEYQLGVTTVDQVKVSALGEMNITGPIIANPGYKCSIPQRIKLPATAAAAAFTAENEFTGENVCGGTATPALFLLQGVKGQSVKISLESVIDASAVAKFKPEAIYAADTGITAGSTDFDYAFTGAGATTATNQTALNGRFKEIYGSGLFTLSPTGFALLRVGGELEITSDQLMPDTAYQVKYNVNITYQ